MSSDVMQHELVERARENGTLTKADITKAWFIYSGRGSFQLL